jgi:hypothetical protein
MVITLSRPQVRPVVFNVWRRNRRRRNALLSQTQAVISAFSTQAPSVREALIDTCVRALVDAGVWAKLDVFYMLAAHHEQAGRVNWKAPSTFVLTPSTVAPTFTTDRGFTGNGTSTYLRTGYNPTTASLGIALNSAHAGVFVRTNSASNNYDIGSDNSRLRIRGRNGTNAAAGLGTGTATAMTTGATNNPRHIMVIRRDSANQLLFNNGVLNQTGVTASNTLTTTIDILRDATTAFSDRQVACAHVGPALSDAEALALYTAIAAYMSAVGAG